MSCPVALWAKSFYKSFSKKGRRYFNIFNSCLLIIDLSSFTPSSITFFKNSSHVYCRVLLDTIRFWRNEDWLYTSIRTSSINNEQVLPKVIWQKAASSSCHPTHSPAACAGHAHSPSVGTKYTLQLAETCSPQKCPFPWWIWTPSNTLFSASGSFSSASDSLYWMIMVLNQISLLTYPYE